MREAGSRLACVVVELHQAEDQVRGHQLKRVGGIGYDIPAGEGTRLSPPGPTKDDVLSVETQSPYPPFGTLALTVEVCVPQPIDAKAQHVVGFEGFAEEVTIATPILQCDPNKTCS